VIDLHAAWARGHHASETIGELARRLQQFCRERYSVAAG
jgi:hypothetical protein